MREGLTACARLYVISNTRVAYRLVTTWRHPSNDLKLLTKKTIHDPGYKLTKLLFYIQI